MASESYLRFENEFYKVAKDTIPLPMLVGDMERFMEQTNTHYFILPPHQSNDNKEHYFYFKKASHHLYQDDDLVEFDYSL